MVIGTVRAAAGWRAVLVLALGTAMGCGIDDEPGEDGATGSGAEDDLGPGEGAEGDPAGSDVPAIDYCAGVATWDEQARAFEAEVVDRVNQARAEGATCGGRPFRATSPLAMEPRLRCAARVHSLDMAERGFFDHDNPDGESPFDRMERAGYELRAAGENIAGGQGSPREVVDGWLLSPGHCSNIMSPDFTQIGVGYVATPSAELPTYWTQTFGAPL